MKERIFIQKSKENISMEEFIRKKFAAAKCGRIEVQHTPIVTRIVIYTTTPGMVIGAGGERIKETIDMLKAGFNIENPQIDVQRIANSDLEPYIVAQSIAASIENGVNYKKLGNIYLERIMSAGAIGCEIVLKGKLGGERSRKARFTKGYLKKCGEPAQKDVLYGFAVANPRLGNIGILVKIMLSHTESLKKISEDMVRAQAALAAEAAVAAAGTAEETQSAAVEAKPEEKKEAAEGEAKTAEEVKTE